MEYKNIKITTRIKILIIILGLLVAGIMGWFIFESNFFKITPKDSTSENVITPFGENDVTIIEGYAKIDKDNNAEIVGQLVDYGKMIRFGKVGNRDSADTKLEVFYLNFNNDTDKKTAAEMEKSGKTVKVTGKVFTTKNVIKAPNIECVENDEQGKTVPAPCPFSKGKDREIITENIKVEKIEIFITK